MAEKPSLAAFLSKHSRLGLDTSVFIYFVQEHSTYHSLCVPFFEAIENGKIEASTSTLSLLEVLVQPYRVKREDLVLKFYALLTTYPHLRWIGLSKDIADTAARMRAEYRLRTPAAIQAATAVCSGATGFICNDAMFRKVKEIDCLLLDDCLRVKGAFPGLSQVGQRSLNGPS